MMLYDEPEKLFIERAKDLLDRSAENLDSGTRQRLEHIRMNALKTGDENRFGFFLSHRWVTVGGFATATSAAVTLFFWLHASTVELPTKNIEDFEIISSHERIDFFQDLDFYRWLATQGGSTEKAVSL